MAVFSRCVGLVLALTGVNGVRKQNRRTNAKMLAGVPVYNFDKAFGGSASLAEAQGAEDWVVMMKAGTSDADIAALCQSAAGCKLAGHGGRGVPFFEVRGSVAELESVIKAAGGAVLMVEPDLMLSPIPEVDTQAESLASADVESSQWNLERVGAPLRGSTGVGVHIYVVDTGIRSSHNDFGGRVIPSIDLTSGSLVECNGDQSCAPDMQGHGTHCAGTAGGASYGVAPGATLHSCRVFNTGESPFSWTISSLDWIVNKGETPAIASMSLGGEVVLESLRVAVDSSVDAGLTVVVAAGNSDKDACGFSPAHVPAAITVGATQRGDVRSAFSNYGSCVDIWAPGSNILSAGKNSDTDSKMLDGTSMACPQVAGGAALLLESNPSLTPAEVASELVSTATVDALADLKDGDVNRLLWVGAGGAPAPTAATCPDGTSGPDADGDCMCTRGRCYSNGGYGCPYSSGTQSGKYFRPGCFGCKCMR